MADDDFQTAEQEDLGSQFSTPVDQTPGFFSGLGARGPLGPIGEGVDRALLYGASAIVHNNNTWSPPSLTPPNLSARAKETLGLTDQEKESDFERTARETANQMAPDARTAGMAYRTLQSLAEFGTEVAVGGRLGGVGALMATSGTTRYEAFHQYRDEGVDAETAERLANIDAGVSGIFAVSGGLGHVGLSETSSLARKFMQEAAAGVATNVPLGVANRYLDHQILEKAGYPGLAEQQQAWDGISLLTDVGTGLIPAAVLGSHEALLGISKVAKTALKDHGLARDAADVAARQRGTSELAPGIPVGPDSAEFHETALRTAAAQNLAGETVDLTKADLPPAATFVTRPSDEPSPAVRAFAEHLDSARVSEQMSLLDQDTRSLVERFTGEKLPERTEQAEHVEPSPEPEIPAVVPRPAALAEDQESNTVPLRGELLPRESPEQVEVEPKAKATSTEDLPPEKDVDLTRKGPVWRAPDPKRDSLLQYMVRHSKGIDMKEAEAQGIDRADMKSREATIGIRRAFRKGGLSFDEAAELLYQEGYPVTDEQGKYNPNSLLDAIDKELRGDKVWSTRNHAELERQAEEHFEEQRQAGIRAAKEALAKEPERASMDAEFMALWRHDDLDIETRKMASDQWDNAKTLAERRDVIDLVQSKLEDIQRRMYENEHEERTTGGEADGNGKEPPETLTLSSESAAELKARGEREQQRAAADEQAIRLAGERERADRERDQFSLTGSDRASDSNPRQTDLVQAAVARRPLMEIPAADGRIVDAAPVVEQAKLLEEQANTEADKAFKAATDCSNQEPPF